VETTAVATTEICASLGNPEVVKHTLCRECDLQQWSGLAQPYDCICDWWETNTSGLFGWMGHLTQLLFHQMYVICVLLRDSLISCLYAFISNKSQSTYEELLQSIQNKCQELAFQSDPSTVITEFELAIISAVGSMFGPHTKSHDCFYHLMQNMWRKILSETCTSVLEERWCKTFLWHVGWFGIFPNRWCRFQNPILDGKHTRWTWANNRLLRQHIYLLSVSLFPATDTIR